MSGRKRRLEQPSIKTLFQSTANKKKLPHTHLASMATGNVNPDFVQYATPPLDWIESGEECQICLEAYRPDERVRLLKCWCRFHERCIIHWLGYRQSKRLSGEFACPVHSENACFQTAPAANMQARSTSFTATTCIYTDASIGDTAAIITIDD